MSVFHNMEPYHHEYYLNSSSVLSSPSPSSVCSMNTDGNIHLYGSTMSSPMSGSVSPLSSSMSPISSSDSSSAYNFQHLQISANSNGYMVNSMTRRMDEAFLEITEQPIDKFRFRYKSEMHGTHGMLTGQHSKKTFPTVRLRNFDGEALIRCSLYQIMKPGHEMPFPHSHSLVVRCGNEDKKDPHEVMVSQLHGYKATFQGMGIIHTARRYIEDELYEKLAVRAEFEANRALTKSEQDTLRSNAKKHSSDMNLNQVSLCFEAYECVNGKWSRLCEPIFSTPINNLKSALTGDLKISRMSTVVGNAAGNDDLFVFVEKVGKKNIKVRFFELDDDQLVWEDWGKFTEADVHHQYAIALKTPPYRKTNFDESVKVYIQLYRPGDEASSEPVEFRYKPSQNINVNGKRPRVSSFYDSVIPLVVTENQFVRNPSDSYVPQCDTMTDDNCDIEQMFPDLFSNNKPTTDEMILNPEEINSLLRTLNENIEFDKLAKDSAKCDDDHPRSLSLSKEEKWIAQLLDQIEPLLKSTIDTERSKMSRKFVEFVFNKALFNGDTMVHVCLRSDDLKLMDRLWQVLNKFQLHHLLNSRNHHKETSLHLASALNKPSVLNEAIKYGADLDAVDTDGNTALHVAIESDSTECVATILKSESAIDLGILNDNGYTPLHLASIKNNLNVVKMLDTKAAQTKQEIFDDIEGKHGNNALHIAIESDARDVAEYLIQNKCISPSKVNKSGHTAMYLARVSKNNELVNLMQRHIVIDDEIYMEDDDDASSKDSFESQELTRTAELKKLDALSKRVDDLNKVELKQAEKKFDDICFTELSEIFNKNTKWKTIAAVLGYQEYIAAWHKLRNPTKVLLVYAETLNVAKSTLAEMFTELGEKRAHDCIDEWRARV